MRNARSLTVSMALAVGVSILGSSVSVAVPTPASGSGGAAAGVDAGPEPVSPHPVRGLALPADPADHSAGLPDRISELPEGEGAVQAAESWQSVPGLPLRLRATGELGSGQAVPVSVSIGRPEAASPGTIVLALGRDTAAAASPGPAGASGGLEKVEVELSYADIRYVFAGDWGSRLRVLAFPACFLSTPQVSRCAQGREVASVNDTAKETVTFSAAVSQGAGRSEGSMDPNQPSDAAPTSEGSLSAPRARAAVFGEPVAAAPEPETVYVLAASPSGESGDYGAAPIEPAAAWQVGEGAGNFSYSYPFELTPAAVGGPAPDLGLSYNSALVDGMNRARNGQAPMAGMGWALEPGYIVREYARCTDDGFAAPKADLCWKTTTGNGLVEELTIVLNGRSSKLIQVDHTNTFRLQDDPGWQVTRVYGSGSDDPSNTDNDNEAFRVRTPDGTEYWFGWGRGSSSTLTVPVYGNNSGEPCKQSTVATSWCQQAWRWGLDRVIDANGNKIAYSYDREINYYGRFGDSSQQTVYDANGYLTGIEYGHSRSGNSGAYSLVSLSTRPRCTPALTDDDPSRCTGQEGPTVSPELWPDVPTDFSCNTQALCTNYSPTFFSLKRYDAIYTRRMANNQLYLADKYQLTHQLPQPGPDGGIGIQDLWLESIKRTGESGPAEALPAVNFDGVWLQNRVVPNGGHPFMKLRIDSILTETGGRIDVRYGHAEGRACDAAYVSGRAEWDSTRECYRQEFNDNQEWWHKYVVTRVGLSDDALGYRLGGAAQPGPSLGRLRVYDYEYGGAPGWRYTKSPQKPESQKTWDDWRGYETVTVHTRKVGPNQVPDADEDGISDPYAPGTDLSRRKVIVYRGLYGSPSNNSGGTKTDTITTTEGGVENDWGYLNGRVAEDTLQDGDGIAISRSYTGYDRFRTATNPWALDAYYVYPNRTVATPRVGGPKHTRTYVVDAGGSDSRGVRLGALLESHDDQGTPGNSNDDLASCPTWVVDSVSRLRVVSKALLRNGSCDTSAALLSRTEVAYDGGGIGTAPTAGNPTLVIGYADAATEVRTETTYDLYGRVKKQSLPYSPGQTPQWTTTAYNPGADSHDLLTIVEETGPVVDADTPAFTTSTLLTPHRGLVSRVQDANGQLTILGRDALGRVTAVTGSGNNSGTPNVAYDYLVRQGAPSKVVSHTLRDTGANHAVDHATTFVDGWGRGVETHLRNQNGSGALVSATGYDERGLLRLSMPAFWVQGADATPSTITNPDPAQVGHYSETTYDAAARPLIVWDKTMGAANRATRYTYTATADEVSVTKPAGDKLTTTRTELDPLGRPAKRFQYGNGATPDPTAQKSFDDGYAQYTYTLTGQLDTIKKPKSANPTDLITYNYDYDQLGRRTSSTDPDTGDTSYTYDALGNLTRVDDAMPNDTMGWVETSYDVLGRPLLREQVKDNGNRATLGTWTYDASLRGLGRITSTSSTTGLGQFTTSVAGYDQRGNPQDTTYTYPGNLTGESLVTTPKTKTYSYTYNQLDQPVTVDYPAGPHLDAISTTTSYGRYGAFQSLATSDGRVLGTTAYDNIDRPIGLDSQTPGLQEFALRRSYTWDDRDRLTGLDGATGSTSTGTAVTQLSLAYQYDTLGSPLRITGTRQDSVGAAPTTAAWCYTYDGISRIKTAATGLPTAGTSTGCDTATQAQVTPVTGKLYNLAYTYAQGRLSTVSSGTHTVTYSYDDPAHPHAATGLTYNQLLGAPDAGLPSPGTLTYDPAGRATRWDPAAGGGGATNYTYDVQGNQINADNTALGGGIDAKNAYDVNGIRVARQSQGNTIYAGPTEISKPGALGAAVTRRYFTTPGSTPLAIQTSDGNDAGTEPDWTWLLADGQGTVRLSKRDNALTPTQHTYYPFGDPIPDAKSLPGQRGYLNKTHDPNGDIRLDHRAYNPGLNILTTPDPLMRPGDPRTLNPYTYAAHNPISGGDPSGLYREETAEGGSAPDGYSTMCQSPGSTICQVFLDAAANRSAPGGSDGDDGGHFYDPGRDWLAGAWAGTADALPFQFSDLCWSPYGGCGDSEPPSHREVAADMLGADEDSMWNSGGYWFGIPSLVSVRSLSLKLGRDLSNRLVNRFARRNANDAVETTGEAARSMVRRKNWPDGDGFVGGTSKVTVLKPGRLIDRFGYNGGRYAAPQGTPFGARGLSSDRASDPYSVFVVQRRLVVRGGIADAWMGSGGGGVQYLLPASVEDLLNAGYIVKVG